jgi:hypothetical protein
MEKRFGKRRGSRSHENLGPKVGGGDEGEGTNVVVMGMRDENRFKVFWDLVQQRSRVPTIQAGVHSRIEKHGVISSAE